MGDGYEPLDALRSSYGLQRTELKLGKEIRTGLFDETKNLASETAWACVVYSMVPYLGILFVPFAFASGGLGYVSAQRQLDAEGMRLARLCIGLSFVVLILQIFLWWLLYIIPEIGI